MRSRRAKRGCRCGWSSEIQPVAIIGGGLAGLTAAIRLAEQGITVDLYEAAPKAGGRTRSFYDTTTDTLCDHGPHLLIGAYRATRQLLRDCDATAHIHWQPSLDLPLWERSRGHFHFQPAAWLPFPLALIGAAAQMPGHRAASALAMLKMALAMRRDPPPDRTVDEWIAGLKLPRPLTRDLLEPLCLGAMNEPMARANAASFARVLRESFAGRRQARLGWFTRPLDEALIHPLCQRARSLGVQFHLRCPIRKIDIRPHTLRINGRSHHRAILALPAYARDRLLGIPSQTRTQPITNIHLWFEEPVDLTQPLVGGIGTSGQWFFDIDRQMQQSAPLHHLCVVISAAAAMDQDELLSRVTREIQAISGASRLRPLHRRIITEKRATVVVQPRRHTPDLPPALIDASEAPAAGDLPATIELAVLRGTAAAQRLLNQT